MCVCVCVCGLKHRAQTQPPSQLHKLLTLSALQGCKVEAGSGQELELEQHNTLHCSQILLKAVANIYCDSSKQVRTREELVRSAG